MVLPAFTMAWWMTTQKYDRPMRLWMIGRILFGFFVTLGWQVDLHLSAVLQVRCGLSYAP